MSRNGVSSVLELVNNSILRMFDRPIHPEITVRYVQTVGFRIYEPHRKTTMRNKRFSANERMIVEECSKEIERGRTDTPIILTAIRYNKIVNLEIYTPVDATVLKWITVLHPVQLSRSKVNLL